MYTESMTRSQNRKATQNRVNRMVAGVQQLSELHAYAKERNQQLIYLPRSRSFYLLDTQSPGAMEQFRQRYLDDLQE